MPTDQTGSDLLDQPASKSHVKREMHALLDLGRRLIALPAGQLKQLPVSEKLYEAIVLAQRTTSREALRRQVHYVGRLMRDADAEAIEQQLSLSQSGNDEQTRALQRVEVLRDQLLQNDEALTGLLNDHPGADVQHLRALIRAGRKESQHNASLQPGQSPQRKHYRALFQALKTLNETR